MQNIEKLDMTRVSSKGQLVIPKDIRERMKLKEGSILAVVPYGDMVVLKKVDNKISEEDVRTLRRVDEAWEDIEKGRYKKARVEDFLKKLRTWRSETR